METLSYCQLMERCIALAAENESIKFYLRNGPVIRKGGELATAHQFAPETPATDSFLAEVRAEDVEMVIAYHRERVEALHHVDRNNAIRHSMAALDASDVAAQLRQDANTAELVAAGIITKVGE